MTYLPSEAWVAVFALSGVGILAVLRTLALCFAHQREVHDLRVRTADLRRSYAARLAALRARETGRAAEVAGTIGLDSAQEPLRQAA